MAGELRYDTVTGKLMYDNSTGQLVYTCSEGETCTGGGDFPLDGWPDTVILEEKDLSAFSDFYDAVESDTDWPGTLDWDGSTWFSSEVTGPGPALARRIYGGKLVYNVSLVPTCVDGHVLYQLTVTYYYGPGNLMIFTGFKTSSGAGPTGTYTNTISGNPWNFATWDVT